MPVSPDVTGFFDPVTSTVTYLVADLVSRDAAIIDSVLDYEASSGRTSTQSADALLAEVAARGLKVAWILETHAHADHLTAAPYLKAKLGAPVGIGANIIAVQRHFGDVFNIAATLAPGGRDFDRLFAADEALSIGGISGRVMATPGHTPACVSYLFGNAAFVGDTLFMPDYGTARCDFPGGDAATLYRSIRRILALDPATRVFVGHDYAPGGRAHAWETTVRAQNEANVHVRQGISEAEFVTMRTARDATLGLPALILPSVQVNIRAGQLPPAESNGVAYLKIPLNAM
ncbi:MAG: MBL fold metallo-hydrolase [Rhodospirillaceae bacterium]|nr:MBL fold metallo-hydrolase [Rhodospirillaceae bacterium]